MITLGSLTLTASMANNQGVRSVSDPLVIIIREPEPSPIVVEKREDAINRIVSSIAMEELALSHILNAEGEKIQYAVGAIPSSIDREATSIDDVMLINGSVNRMLLSYADMQILLGDKLSNALDSYEYTNF